MQKIRPQIVEMAMLAKLKRGFELIRLGFVIEGLAEELNLGGCDEQFAPLFLQDPSVAGYSGRPWPFFAWLL
jgi:hypothetical protein